ncbi:MAG: ATP-binding protein [Chthoniobacterales bacterium]
MKHTIELASDTSMLANMRHAAREFLESTTLDEMQAELIVLALDEACTNIIRHAYEGRDDCPIHLSLDAVPDRIVCVIRDFGKSCDPAKIRSRELDDFRPGGLGVRIMQTAFDEVKFEPRQQGTELTMIKYLRPVGERATQARDA